MEKQASNQFNRYFTNSLSASSDEEETFLLNTRESVRGYLLQAQAKLIPGIPSIEKLPEDIEQPESYFYTGLLTVKDNPTPQLSKQLTSFFSYHNNKKVVFVTTGSVDRSEVSSVIHHLLEKDYAVITTVPTTLSTVYQDRLFFNPFLPLNFVCSEVDLVVHHCGSGMYHYPLLHQKPTITLGTQCYDREDVALRLSQLGVSKHTPSPYDDTFYLDIFKQNLEDFENHALCDFTKLRQIREEIIATMLSFNMEAVINYTLNKNTMFS